MFFYSIGNLLIAKIAGHSANKAFFLIFNSLKINSNKNYKKTFKNVYKTFFILNKQIKKEITTQQH